MSDALPGELTAARQSPPPLVRQENLRRVFAPIGLDIGADAPMEIAVSVLAEVLAVLLQRTADHLRPE